MNLRYGLSRRSLIALGASALALAVAAALLLFLTSRADAQARAPVYGGGVAINVAAPAMLPRATVGCPATPNGFCQSRPGVIGPLPGTTNDGFLLDAEGDFFAPVQMPAGARLVRVEIVGLNTDVARLASPNVTLTEAPAGKPQRSFAPAVLQAGAGVRRAWVTFSATRPPIVSGDAAYTLQLNIPRLVGSGANSIQMVRVLYRPRIK